MKGGVRHPRWTQQQFPAPSMLRSGDPTSMSCVRTQEAREGDRSRSQTRGLFFANKDLDLCLRDMDRCEEL